MTFDATKRHVSNRGVPPQDFLEAIVNWCRAADDSIFAPNQAHDIYTLIRPSLAPDGWSGIPHRRAAMLEAMRVHAGLESSWDWEEGKDPGNPSDDPKTWEAGPFQVSFDSTEIHNSAMLPYAKDHGIGSVQSFRCWMRTEHQLAIDYYAKLVRISISWAGPLIRGEILPFLSREAVAEFQTLVN